MLLVLSLSLNLAVLAVAGYKMFNSRHTPSQMTGHPHDMEHHFHKVLGLSADQMTRMRPLAHTFHHQLNQMQMQMSEKKEKMLSLLEDDTDTSRQIETLRSQMAMIQDRIQKTVIDHVLEVKAVLDTDQQERFFTLLHKSMVNEDNVFNTAGGD